MIRVNGDPIEWRKSITKKTAPVTKSVTSAPPVTKNVTQPRDGLSGGFCPTCGHRMPLTAAERKRAERARKRAADPA
jgi:hypothetical protein